MTVTMTRNGNELTVALDGRLDTLTAPDLEEQLEPALEGVEKLVEFMKAYEKENG